VGELPDARRAGRIGFAAAGDAIAVIGPFEPSLDGSELAKLRGEPLAEELPACDPAIVRTAQTAVRQAVRAGTLSSAHDVAEGGLAVALAECCLAGAVGARVDLGEQTDPAVALFGEGPGRFLVSGPPDALAAFGEAAKVIGTVGGERLAIDASPARLDVPVAELREIYERGLAGALG
jgi:phosphoribosylformylglycinamidine synthase